MRYPPEKVCRINLWPSTRTINKPMTPTAEDVASVMNGTDTLYFFGVITYEDDFWWRATSFCFAYMPEASPSSMAAFGACPTGGTPLLK
jgi:hypothetical protein